MTQSVTQIAQSASAAYKKLSTFEATQKITAGNINVEAHIRFKKPDKITVEYGSYDNPLADFEERLSGGGEFSADELLGLQITYDGTSTWLYESRRDVAIEKQGRSLFSPLRGLSSIAEIGFLAALAHDFLLRDDGEDVVSGRKAYKVGIKPKSAHRSLLLKEEAFPVQRGVLFLDKETFFPLKIAYYPTQASPHYYLVGSSSPITIEYANPRLDQVDTDHFSYSPPEGARVFTENQVNRDKLPEILPFEIDLDDLEQDNTYQLYNDMAVVTTEKDGDRGYALLNFASNTNASSNDIASALSLRVGNYLSPNMNRRRALIAEEGDKIEFGQLPVKILDRAELLKDKLPEQIQRSIVEVTWTSDDVHWFLLGEGIDREQLVALVKNFTGS